MPQITETVEVLPTRGGKFRVRIKRVETDYIGFYRHAVEGAPTYRNVLGEYKTYAKAKRAGEFALSIEGPERLCSVRDIDRVRKELRKAK